MISYEEAQEAWYQANLNCARTLRQTEQRIASLEVYKLTIPGQRAELEKKTKAQLLEALTSNSRLLRQAKTGPKAALIDWLIQDRLADNARFIAELWLVIADNQPDPRWRLREGDSLDKGEMR